MKKPKKNIFISGGLGQDGKILINLLSRDKYKVFIFSKKKDKNSYKKCMIIKENLKNKKKIRSYFKKNRPDIVLHMASNNPSFKEKSFRLFYKENLLVTKNIFDETFRSNLNSKFIFFNSSQIFKKKFGKVNENSKLKGSSDYTNFRLKSHKYMIKMKKLKNLKYTNLILFNHDSKYRNKKFIIPRIINAIKERNIIFLKKIVNENIYADFSHAEDICKAILKLISSEKNFDNLILSSGKATSINKIIFFIIKKYNLKLSIKINRNKKQKCLVGKNSLAKIALKWKPKKNVFMASDELYKI